MKKIVALSLALTIAFSALSGCYGKFALTRKVYQVNSEVKDKYLRSLVTWVFIIVPVYGISALADFIAFNTIEFWSGSNPVAEGEKDFHYARNGETYQVNARKSGDAIRYTIDHYNGKNYVDTLTINWDLKSGNSAATLKEFDRTTGFAAVREGSGVNVQQHAQGTGIETPMHVASYR